MSGTIDKRIFVGNINQNLHECCEDLFVRFGKLGKVTSDKFEEHEGFAYVNMEFSEEQEFHKLKTLFNNVKFKGNTLKIDEAKEDFYARWIKENTGDDLNGRIKKNKMLKHEWEHYKRVQNITKTWKDRRQVIYGRDRAVPRPEKQLRKVTFRIMNERGELKVYKCYKNKLWGYDKKKTVRDLVFEFVNEKYWKDGNNHIVERLDFSKSKVFFKNGDVLKVTSKMEDRKGDVKEEKLVDEEVLQKEHNVNNSVLNNFLDSFNFEKPMTLNNGVDEKEENGSSDYEFSNKYLDQSSDEEAVETQEQPPVPAAKPERHHETPAAVVEFDEEFVPSFGASPADGPASNTETLRGLFANKEAAGFKLIHEDDEDIDHAKDKEFAQNEENVENIVPAVPETTFIPTISAKKNQSEGLFFPHLDSYFLVGQTQLSKLQPKEMCNFDDWDKSFWDNRAEWTQEMRQKKRDAVRKWKKKNSKSTLLL